MASTYTGLGTQLMTTGEKAGTWGTLTNTNWNISEQIAGGYTAQALSTTGATTLSVNDECELQWSIFIIYILPVSALSFNRASINSCAPMLVFGIDSSLS